MILFSLFLPHFLQGFFEHFLQTLIDLSQQKYFYYILPIEALHSLQRYVWSDYEIY